MQDFQKQCYEKLELNIIIKKLADIAILPAVKKQILELKPINDLNILNVELTNVEECTGIVRRLERAPFYLASEYDNTLKLLKKGGSLSGLEIYDTVKLYQTISANCNLVNDLNKFQIEANYYRELVNELYINQYINKELIKSIDENGNVLDDASVELKSIRKKLVNIEANVKQKLQEIISKEGSKLSQTSVVLRDDRFCLAVKSEYKNVVKGVIHDTSASMQTCFIEPLAVSQLMNDKVRLLEQEKEEINRILKRLSELLQGEVEVLINNFDNLKKIDLMFAKAVLAISYDGNKPNLNLNCKLDLKNARHPLLKVKKVIPNNVTFGNDYLGIVVTGPNTGGKTVLLKTVGLLCGMVKYGLLIPADSDSNVMIYDQIFCDIGDDQSIESNLSTFSSHMKNITKIIDSVTPNSLVLFDEIGSGTDPIEGSNLAKSILKYLIEHNVSFITTTHYSQLKAFAFDEPKIVNASMEFDQNTLSPTYHLLLGVSGSSNAFNIAKKLGLKEEIIKNAKKITITSDDDIRKLIFKLEKQSKEVEARNIELKQALASVNNEKRELQERLNKIEKERQSILKKAQQEADEFVSKITNEAMDTLNEVKNINKDKVKLHEIIEAKHKVDKLGGTVVTKKMVDKIDQKLAKVGDDVYIKSYDQYGVIERITKDGMYEVAIGNMSLKLNRDDFNVVDKVAYSNQQKSEIGYTKSRASISLTLDLRGKRYEEAKYLLDKYIDDLMASGIKQANIIHGYGTGVIRELVQSYLKNNKNISSYRYGGENEGGFGVTVVTLK